MNISQIRNVQRVYNRPVIRTMEKQAEIAKQGAVTVKDKQKIIESDKKETKKIQSINDIITTKPSSNKVRKFFKERVHLINEHMEDNI